MKYYKKIKILFFIFPLKNVFGDWGLSPIPNPKKVLLNIL